MRVIYKYDLEITDVQQISPPAGALLLNVAFQGDRLCLWALVNTDYRAHDRIIKIYGTGQPVESQIGHYIGTAHDPRGFVWHAFEH